MPLDVYTMIDEGDFTRNPELAISLLDFYLEEVKIDAEFWTREGSALQKVANEIRFNSPAIFRSLKTEEARAAFRARLNQLTALIASEPERIRKRAEDTEKHLQRQADKLSLEVAKYGRPRDSLDKLKEEFNPAPALKPFNIKRYGYLQ